LPEVRHPLLDGTAPSTREVSDRTDDLHGFFNRKDTSMKTQLIMLGLIWHGRCRCVVTVAAVVLVSLATGHPSVGEEAAKQQGFENAAGCAWVVEPIEKYPDSGPDMYFEKVNKRSDKSTPPLTSTTANADWDSFIGLMEEGNDQELVLSYVRPAFVTGFHNIRPVAIDREGTRHELQAVMAGATNGIILERWKSNPTTLPASEVAVVGLEGVTEEGLKMRMDVAREQARERGLSVLPIPACRRCRS
jgi:hypothetical protein